MPTTLSDLFEKNPLDYTTEDRKEIVKAFRDMNHKFNLGDLKAGSVKPRIGKSISGIGADDLKDLLKETKI